MKTLGWVLVAVICGYLVGLFGGMTAIEMFSSNTHDRSMEAAMTGAFVVGPMVAMAAAGVVLIVRSRHVR